MSLPIHQSAQAHPQQLAYLDRAHQIRYTDLAEMLTSNAVRHLANVTAGDHLGWCPGNDLNSYLTFWAMQQRRLVACPISHRFPIATRNEILDRINANWLPSLIENGHEKSRAVDNDLTNRKWDNPATILLSSGSTGRPKAVVHTLGSHLASATGAATNMPLYPGDRWFWSLPLFHVSGLSILMRCAVAGATVVGQDADSKLSASVLEGLRVTHLSVVNTQLRRLLGENGFPSRYLKAVLLGGSGVDSGLVSQARRQGVNVMTTYGLTETASQVTTSTTNDAPQSSGRLLPERQLKISNEGEILVRGSTLCLGYYRAGEIHPIFDDEGWFHTQDLGTLDDSGLLYVKGRVDNMFISGGENIYPESIENAMLSAFNIRQVIVVPKPDRVFGARPVAFVSGELPSAWGSTLRRTLKGYEVPVEIYNWPVEAEEAMKVNRKFFQRLLAD